MHSDGFGAHCDFANVNRSENLFCSRRPVAARDNATFPALRATKGYSKKKCGKGNPFAAFLKYPFP